MLYGYAGSILDIDLSNQRILKKEIESYDVERFIGGSGCGARILYSETTEGTDPLGSENVLVYFTGPFCGTPVPGSGRHSIVSRSPLTGIWGESDVGGKWGAWLKSLGYDGIIIRGASQSPVYLYVRPGKVEIRDARNFWGIDTYEIERLLERQLGHDIAISCIGIAGENLVKLAAIMHDGKHGRAAGRCGLGAVMGSKKLKAIVLAKGEFRPDLYDGEELAKDIRRLLPTIREKRKDATLYGTSRSIPSAEALGDLPIKNWQLGNWTDGAEKISGKRMAETILVGRYSCVGCPLACGRIVNVSTGSFAPVDGGGYEYETGAMLGSSCLVDNMEAIAKANELCNRYGLDTISTGSIISFAMEAFERGVLTEKDTDGLKLEWGNTEVVLQLIELIAKRQGIGEILSRGTKHASEVIGQGSQSFAVQVKGLELPGHDPRCFKGLAVGYATSNRGACHTDSFSYVYEGRTSDPSLNIPEPLDRLTSNGKGKLVSTLQNLMALCDSLKICKFIVFGLEASNLVRWLNYIMGWDMSFEEFIKTGERIFTLKRLYNVRCGVTRRDDKLPVRIVNLARHGLHAPEKLPNLDSMLDEYYLIRNWDTNGIPKLGKLADLGLTTICDEQ